MSYMFKTLLSSLMLVLFFYTIAPAHGTKDKELISPADLASAHGTYHVLDIRSADHYTGGHVPRALSLPISELSESRLKDLGVDFSTPIVLYGVSESAAKKAKMLLDILGYSKIRILAGGYTHWVEDGQGIEKGDPAPSSGIRQVSSMPSLKINPESYDFGVIEKKNGVVDTVFTIGNMSDEEIAITEISTSCGCTTAEIEEKSIPPDEEHKLTVYFDPNFHKEPEGKFSRTVFLQTSDNREILVKIEVEIEN